MRLVLIILLVLLLLGALPVWPYAAGWGMGYWPSSILGLLLLVIIVMALVGERPAV